MYWTDRYECIAFPEADVVDDLDDLSDTAEDVAVRKLFGETLKQTVPNSQEEEEETTELGKYCGDQSK